MTCGWGGGGVGGGEGSGAGPRSASPAGDASKEHRGRVRAGLGAAPDDQPTLIKTNGCAVNAEIHED